MNNLNVRFSRAITEKGDWSVCMYTAPYSDELPADIRANRKGNTCYLMATGNALPKTHYVSIDLNGDWKKSKYGVQFDVKSYSVHLPDETKEIEKFLASGIIPNVGRKTAKHIVDKFGKDTIRVLSEEPEKLMSVRGIGEKYIEVFRESMTLAKGQQNLAGLLARFGMMPDKIVKIQKTLGDNAAEMIQENPYVLMKVKGFGFITADKIAKGMNVGLTGMERRICALEHTLRTISTESGDMYVPVKELLPRTLKLLNDGFKPKIMTEKDVADAFELAVVAGRLIHRFKETLNIVYLPAFDEAEREAAQQIVFFAKHKEHDETLSEAISKWQESAEIKLTAGQKRAVESVIDNRLSVITGGAGTGKTTICKAIIESFAEAYPEKDIHLLAPTSKAARRMKEATGQNTSTIHSALKMRTGEGEVEYCQKLTAGLVIVDEFSMVDSFIAQSLFRACDEDSLIVLIGDVNQLPSVGPGCVLSELIRSDSLCVTHLYKIMRQGDDSPIVANSYQINEGSPELEFSEQFRFLKADRNSAPDLVLSTYLEEVGQYGLEEVAILSPLRKLGDVCADVLNQTVERRLNINGERTFSLHGQTFRVGDRVIQTKNTEHAANGDVGVLKSVEDARDVYGNPEQIFVIRFDEGETVKYNKQDMTHVDLAYAMTVHKSQGSEYKSVIIPLLGKSRLDKRNLLYTAVTRAKEKVTIIGDIGTLNRCILTEDAAKRKSLLANRIYLLMQEEESAGA